MESARTIPSGTVTFLFTDIEGSTRLWEQHPEAMRLALARHDVLLRRAIEAHGGHVFKTIGDQFCAAFATASDATAAAVEVQRAVCAEKWGEMGALRVRVALNTGAVEQRGGDYFGPALNRLARLLAAGHGGQILLSQVTFDLVRDSLDGEPNLRDLGAHRLKDLQQPEHIFQLLLPDSPSDFPPLRSLEAFAHNLPAQLTSFIGREQVVADVKQLLGTTRLLTLTGSGGCGKTRLALQVAAEVLEEYADGAWLVELASLADPAFVPQTVASALGVREQPERSVTETLADHLRGKQVLLVLDNCEHLLSASAQLADALLRSCPSLRIMASSREVLAIGGERSYRVPSLSLPEPGHLSPASRLTEYGAVRLFVERAVFSQPSFAITEQNAPAVAQVCERLDGIPLAIELAAARVRALPVEQMNERLDDMFRLLTGGSRSALPRQQTLRALIDWSYNLLSERERTLLRRLSVFAGGWTLAAAESVCGGEIIEALEVLDLLTSLVDKSLVTYDEHCGEGRYRLLETVRQYARDRLLETGEVAAVRGRHRDWFLALVEQGLLEDETTWLARPEQPRPRDRYRVWHRRSESPWLDRLEGELGNLRLALGWSLESGEAELELRLAGALSLFWEMRSHWEEGRRWLEGSLARSEACRGDGDDAFTEGRAQALLGAGCLATHMGDHTLARARLEESVRLHRELENKDLLAWSLSRLFYETGEASVLEESVALFREVEDEQGLIYTLNYLGGLAVRRRDYARARSHLEESLAIARALGNKNALARPTAGLGLLEWREGDYPAARSLLEESVALRRELKDPFLAVFNNELGVVVCEQGDYRRAAIIFGESLALFQELGNGRGVAHSQAGLGVVAWRQGDPAVARSLCEQSLAVFKAFEGTPGTRPLGPWHLAACLEVLAGIALAEAQFGRAARLFGAEALQHDQVGAHRPPGVQSEHERRVAAARTALGEDAFAAAWSQGQAMSLEEAVRDALKD